MLWGPDLDAPEGALRFDPSDPASLSGLAAPAGVPAASGLFVVSSCVGGAGVSTVALHLARAFSALRRKTLLIEPAGRDWLRTRLELPADARTADAVDDTEDALGLSCLPVSGGFKVLLGVPQDRLDELARRAGKVFDRVVIDAGGAHAPRGAVGGVFILPPTRSAVARGKTALAGQDGVPWAVVCNRLGSGGSLTPALMSKELGRAVDVGLPCTPALRDAEDRGELLPLRYRWVRSVARIAKALDEL